MLIKTFLANDQT